MILKSAWPRADPLEYDDDIVGLRTEIERNP